MPCSRKSSSEVNGLVGAQTDGDDLRINADRKYVVGWEGQHPKKKKFGA